MIPADNKWRERLLNWWFREKDVADELFPDLHKRVGDLLKKDRGTEEEYIALAKEIYRLESAEPEGAIRPPNPAAWPLGMTADLADRKIYRNGVEADLGSSEEAWDLLVTLVRNYPARTPPKALWRKETELSAVYMNVSRLREFIAPLGLDVKNTRGAGYLLAERS